MDPLVANRRILGELKKAKEREVEVVEGEKKRRVDLTDEEFEYLFGLVSRLERW